jgi:hypothetical protein
MKAPVVVNGWAGIEKVGGVWCPGGSGSGDVIDKCFGLQWGKRRLVEIECPVSSWLAETFGSQ